MTWDGVRRKASWTNLALNSAGGSGTCRYCYLDGRVTVQVNVTGAGILTGSTPTIIVAAANGLPAELRPSVSEYGLANQGGNQMGFGVINTDGSIAAGAEGTASATRTTLRFTVNYIPN